MNHLWRWYPPSADIHGIDFSEDESVIFFAALLYPMGISQIHSLVHVLSL